LNSIGFFKERTYQKRRRNTTTKIILEITQSATKIDKYDVKMTTPNLSGFGATQGTYPGGCVYCGTGLDLEPTDFILSSQMVCTAGSYVKWKRKLNYGQKCQLQTARVGSQTIKNLDALVGQKFGHFNTIIIPNLNIQRLVMEVNDVGFGCHHIGRS
jgi:hypothetical protein